MYEVTVSSTDDMQLEVNARLAAMGTFLRDLDGDPAAGPLFRKMVAQISDLVACGIDGLDYTPRHLRRLLEALAALRKAVDALPEGRCCSSEQWQRVGAHHQECRKAFSRFCAALPPCGITQYFANQHAVAV